MRFVRRSPLQERIDKGLQQNPTAEPKFKRGDRVHKTGGDYEFDGWVVAVYNKRRSGLVRYVVEDARGMNMIMSEGQLKEGPAGGRES